MRSKVSVFVALAFLSSSVALGQENTPERVAREWYSTLTGKSPDAIGESLELDIQTLPKENSCFPEKELVHLCHLDTHAVKYVSIFRDSCSREDKLTEKGLTILAHCLPNLEEIDADANEVTDFFPFAAFPKTLTNIKLIFNYGLRDGDLGGIQALPALTGLNMQSVALSDRAFQSLRSPSLQFLKFQGSELSALTGIGERLPALRVLESTARSFGKSDLEALAGLRDLVSVAMAGLHEDARRWQVESSDTLWINGSFSKEEVLKALARRSSFSQVYVDRPLDDEETEALLSHRFQRLIINDMSTIGFLDALSNASDFRAQELVLERSWFEFYNGETGAWESYRPLLKESLRGRVGALKTWHHEEKYDWSPRKIVIRAVE